MSYVCLDSETCGFHGPIVLFQWAEGDDGPIHLHSVFKEPVRETLKLFEWVANHPGGILGFNLTFDWFKIQQAYTTLRLLDPDKCPEDQIEDYALAEPKARDGPCIKPVKAMDLMLHARKGPWQSLMARDDIVIRRVPSVMAKMLVQELEHRIAFPDIFFHKRKKHESKWAIVPQPNNPDWSNVVLRFAPSSALKALATQELGLDPRETLVFSDVEVDRKWMPVENGFAPFALSVGKPGAWNGAWPDVIVHHVNHWLYNALARKYAERDIEYPRKLWIKWDRPEFGDDDSELACLVGSQRWKGYSINLKGIKHLRSKAAVTRKQHPIAPKKAMEYLKAVMQPEEELALQDEDGKPSTKRVILEELVKMRQCSKCVDGARHDECVLAPHPASLRAKGVLQSRKAKKDLELYDKLILAGRFMASATVTGAKSGRMSGGQVKEGKKGKKSGSLNPHGIQKRKVVRGQFQLAFTEGMIEVMDLGGSITEPEELWGGDFDKFEVCIADAYYRDPQLHEDLTGCEVKRDGSLGKPGSIKIHAVIGTMAYPHAKCGNTKSCGKPSCTDYWFIRDTDGGDEESNFRKLGVAVPDLYTRAKSAFFALIYFGNAYTLATRLGIPVEDGEVVYQRIMARYPVMAKKREEFEVRFKALSQPGGISSKVFWKDPDDCQLSMLGFPRFFTSENMVAKALFELSNSVPKEWRGVQIKVQRKADRWQTAAGSVQSALLGAAFQVLGANVRAAGNHVVQATGAQLTKKLQRGIWNLQPSGVHPWLVRPLNVHDELLNPSQKRVVPKVKAIQTDFIAEHKDLVSLLAMKWKKLNSWAGK